MESSADDSGSSSPSKRPSFRPSLLSPNGLKRKDSLGLFRGASLRNLIKQADSNHRRMVELEDSEHSNFANFSSMSNESNNDATTNATGATASTTASLASSDATGGGPPPTLRVQLTLSGPYRTEIAALVGIGQSWFRVMDQMEAGLVAVRDKLPLKVLQFDPRWLVVPAVPLVAVLVVSAPAIAGVLIVGLPMVLPVVVAAGGILVALIALGAVLYASTSAGRQQVGGLVAPLQSTLLASRSGQRAVYQTGPRPTPVGLAQTILPTTIWQKLFVSLFIDLLGSATYLLPGIGEALDVGPKCTSYRRTFGSLLPRFNKEAEQNRWLHS